MGLLKNKSTGNLFDPSKKPVTFGIQKSHSKSNIIHNKALSELKKARLRVQALEPKNHQERQNDKQWLEFIEAKKKLAILEHYHDRLGRIDRQKFIDEIERENLPLIQAEKGFHGIIRRDTILRVGEGGKAERVDVTPLNVKNRNLEIKEDIQGREGDANVIGDVIDSNGKKYRQEVATILFDGQVYFDTDISTDSDGVILSKNDVQIIKKYAEKKGSDYEKRQKNRRDSRGTPHLSWNNLSWGNKTKLEMNGINEIAWEGASENTRKRYEQEVGIDNHL